MLKRRKLLSTIAASLAVGTIAAMLTPLSAQATPALHLHANGSIDEAWLTGANPSDSIQLEQNGVPVGAPAAADSLGSLIVRSLTPGTGYDFSDTTASLTTASFSVLAPGANPATNSALYTTQPMHVGLNYIRMRDGIKLAATLRLPVGATSLSQGPFPTVIEYSGYGTAAPADPIPCLIGSNPARCSNPLIPDASTVVGSLIARANGFATVSVQMRGTACSGGAFDLFGYPSDYDGYDMIETVAHQSWTANHKVGMVGISYSGISQLEVAGTQPPDLAAITPLSPTDDLFSTGYPGGIYNNGFAASWIADRIHDAKPALTYSFSPYAAIDPSVAQHWTYAEIAKELTATGGVSSVCRANQSLHAQSESLSTLVGPTTTRDPALFDRRSNMVWASHINVPVFISGALQDEQTGPQWPALLSAFPSTTPVFANMVNGGHIDSLDPVTASRWLEFLQIFVAKKVPTTPSFLGGLTLGFAGIASSNAPAITPPAARFTNDTTLAQARSDFKTATPRVRVLFDSGGGSLGAGALQPTYKANFSSWPPAGTSTTLYLGSSGTLSETAPVSPSTDNFNPNPSARPQTDLNVGSNVWAAQPSWNWTTVPSGAGLAYQTAPLAQDTTIVGPASLDLQLSSTATTSDLQVTVTEVRPGTSKEEYVTSGFIRSDYRSMLSGSTDIWPLPNFWPATGALTPGTPATVRVPIDPIAHTFRAGTELRIVITAPGGDRPAWTFASPATGGTVVDSLGLGGVTPSKLVVNEVAGVTAAAKPVCGSLRGEPCRALVAASNQP